jgi:hypothetical protein
VALFNDEDLEDAGEILLLLVCVRASAVEASVSRTQALGETSPGHELGSTRPPTKGIRIGLLDTITGMPGKSGGRDVMTQLATMLTGKGGDGLGLSRLMDQFKSAGLGD